MPKKNLKKAKKDWEKSLNGAKERQPEFLTTSSVPNGIALFEMSQ